MNCGIRNADCGIELKATSRSVIPPKAGIQKLLTSLDSRLRGSDELIVIRGSLEFKWSPTGIARGTHLHAQVGRHPGQTLAHSSRGKARGLLLPG